MSVLDIWKVRQVASFQFSRNKQNSHHIDGGEYSLLQRITNSEKNHNFLNFPEPVTKKISESKVLLVQYFVNTYSWDHFGVISWKIFIKNILRPSNQVYVISECKKSKMAVKIQDTGRIFLCNLTKRLVMALKNYHTKMVLAASL